MAAAAIPAVGAIAGGLLAKKQGVNPLLGAAMGGLGGYALGPAMGGLSGLSGAAGAAGSAIPAGATNAAVLGGNIAVPFSSAAAGQAAMAQTAPGMAGLFSRAMANPQMMSKLMGQAAQIAGGGGQQQAMPSAPPPMPMQPQANRANPGTMASMGQTGNMYQPRRTSLLG